MDCDCRNPPQWPIISQQCGRSTAVIGDVLGVGRTDADVHRGDAVAVFGNQVIGRHLVTVPEHTADDRLRLALLHATPR